VAVGPREWRRLHLVAGIRHGTVFFGAGDGRVYAVNAATGKEKWHAQAEGRVRASPAVDASRVYVGSADGRVYAFDRATGATNGGSRPKA
jgi:outer membrane protein assembly factor BamB